MSRSTAKLANWIAAARDGSDDALGESLEACRAYLMLVARQEIDPSLMAKAGASDLVQETFLEAQRDFGNFRGLTEAEFLGWLRRILLNNLANFQRHYRRTDKRKVTREVAIDGNRSSQHLENWLKTTSSSPSSHAIQNEQAAAMEQALARLPHEYLQAIMLRNREGHSFEQIGQLMNRSANAARKLWGRAVERLQQEMETFHER